MMLMPKKLHAPMIATQAIAPTATLFIIALALAFFSPKAPAASMAAISSEDRSRALHSDSLQTIDSVKPTNITSRKVTLQTRLL